MQPLLDAAAVPLQEDASACALPPTSAPPSAPVSPTGFCGSASLHGSLQPGLPAPAHSSAKIYSGPDEGPVEVAPSAAAVPKAEPLAVSAAPPPYAAPQGRSATSLPASQSRDAQSGSSAAAAAAHGSVLELSVASDPVSEHVCLQLVAVADDTSGAATAAATGSCGGDRYRFLLSLHYAPPSAAVSMPACLVLSP